MTRSDCIHCSFTQSVADNEVEYCSILNKPKNIFSKLRISRSIQEI